MKKFIDCAFKIIFSRTLIIIVMILLQIMVLLAGFTWLGRSMSFIWEIMNVLGALLVIHIINKDEPTEFKMSWIIIICLLPVFGALIYLLVVGNFGGLGLKKTFAGMCQGNGRTGRNLQGDRPCNHAKLQAVPGLCPLYGTDGRLSCLS